MSGDAGREDGLAAAVQLTSCSIVLITLAELFVLVFIGGTVTIVRSFRWQR